MIGYTYGQKLDQKCSFMTLGVIVLIKISKLVHMLKIYNVSSMPSVKNAQWVDHKCKHMTRGISMVNNVNSLLRFKCRTFISKIPMCYAKYQTLNDYLCWQLEDVTKTKLLGI